MTRVIAWFRAALAPPVVVVRPLVIEERISIATPQRRSFNESAHKRP